MADVLNHPTPMRAPFYHSPLGYYGNSRNIVVSGSPVYRFAGVTAGQFQADGPAQSGASKKFDFELELGVYLARPSRIGQRIKLGEVDDYVFGFVLLNDWSGQSPFSFSFFPPLALTYLFPSPFPFSTSRSSRLLPYLSLLFPFPFSTILKFLPKPHSLPTRQP